MAGRGGRRLGQRAVQRLEPQPQALQPIDARLGRRPRAGRARPVRLWVGVGPPREAGELGQWPPPPPPAPKKLAAEYEGKDMDVFVRDALPGKPSRKIEEVVRRLEEIDIDCVDDIQCVAETVQTPAKLTKWLEDESKMPSVTAMRITKMFFP